MIKINLNSTRVFWMSLLVCTIITALLSCSKKTEADNKVMVISLFGKVEIVQSDGKARPLNLKDIISKGDIIKTGTRSQITFQIGNSTLVKIESGSRVKINSLQKSGYTEIDLKNGQILSKLKKIKKGTGYYIKTPIAVAAVRGTEFSVTYRPGIATAAVKSGKVDVWKSGKKENNKIIASGKTAVISENISVGDISKVESLEIKKVSEIDYININDLNKIDTIKLNKKIHDTDIEIEDEIKKILKNKNQPKTLKEIKEIYKRIDEVTLYNGKVYKGAIISRGKIYKMHTVYGIVSVPASKVKRTRVIK